jgi:hypothetical protein
VERITGRARSASALFSTRRSVSAAICGRTRRAKPLAGQKVTIELPDGTRIEETLDADGRLSRKDIPARWATLHLPEE